MTAPNTIVLPKTPSAAEVHTLARSLRTRLMDSGPHWRMTNAAGLMRQALRTPESLTGKKLERFLEVCQDHGIAVAPFA